MSVFEVNIRFIGGLLAAYYLSGQEVRYYFVFCWILTGFFANVFEMEKSCKRCPESLKQLCNQYFLCEGSVKDSMSVWVP